MVRLSNATESSNKEKKTNLECTRFSKIVKGVRCTDQAMRDCTTGMVSDVSKGDYMRAKQLF